MKQVPRQIIAVTIVLLLLSGGQTYIKSKTGSEIVEENKRTNTNNMNIKYAYTILYVKNVEEAIEFYKNVFGFEEKFLTPEKDYGEILTGETTLAFATLELGRSNLKKGFIESKAGEKPFGIELAFTTNNVEQLMEHANKEGAIILEEAVTKPWGQKVGYIQDINGFLIEICTPVTTDN